jgi:hypothetical protein
MPKIGERQPRAVSRARRTSTFASWVANRQCMADAAHGCSCTGHRAIWLTIAAHVGGARRTFAHGTHRACRQARSSARTRRRPDTRVVEAVATTVRARACRRMSSRRKANSIALAVELDQSRRRVAGLRWAAARECRPSRCRSAGNDLDGSVAIRQRGRQRARVERRAVLQQNAWVRVDGSVRRTARDFAGAIGGVRHTSQPWPGGGLVACSRGGPVRSDERRRLRAARAAGAAGTSTARGTEKSTPTSDTPHHASRGWARVAGGGCLADRAVRGRAALTRQTLPAPRHFSSVSTAPTSAQSTRRARQCSPPSGECRSSRHAAFDG